MKTRLIFFSVLALGAVLASSCKKSTPAPAPSAPTASMTATIGGKAWTAKTVSTVDNSVTVTVTGTATDGSYLKIVVPTLTTTGTDSLTQGGNYTIQYSTGVTSYLVNSGTIKISGYTKQISLQGTFSATVANASNGNDKRFIGSGSFYGLMPQ